MDWEALSKDDIAKHRPDLVDAFEDDFLKAVEEIEATLAAEEQPEAEAETEVEEQSDEMEPVAEESEEGVTPETATDDEADDDGETVASDEPVLVGAVEGETFTYDEVKQIVLEAAKAIEAKYEARERVRENRLIAHDMLAESGLPTLSQQSIRKGYEDFDGEAADLRESLKESIKEKRAELAQVTGRGVHGLGPSLLTEDDAKPESTDKAGAHAALLSELGLHED
jgi:hypothetical protein